MFATHGLPELLVSDNGTAFTSTEFLRHNGVRHLTSAPYHPSFNGLAERAVQTLKRYMKKGSDDDVQKQFSRFLFRYRSTPHTTTELSPAEMLMGCRLQTHLDLMRPDVSARVHARQCRQKTQHDCHSQQRSVADRLSVCLQLCYRSDMIGRYSCHHQWPVSDSGVSRWQDSPSPFGSHSPLACSSSHFDEHR